MSDVLGYREIPTTVLTSVYYGIAADEKLLKGNWKGNVKRNRRGCSGNATVAGGGGWRMA